MPLTTQEKIKIRHHLGFLNVSESSTFSLGTPAAVETQFVIEGAMNRVPEEALPELRRQLQILDSIEEQMVADHELLAVERIGEITIRQDEQEALVRVYDRWRQSIANLLGVYPNPWDKRDGGINVPVIH